MDFIFESPAMRQVVKLVEQIGSSDAPVMLSGETGAGKEVVATLIQEKSKRALRSFVKINCTAIPKDLLESELFGVVRGAFTGAENKIGVFEAAHLGTLFLDELSDMPIDLQVKILRAVEEKMIKRVGSTEARQVDVRILSAINQDPEACVANKSLREDLYYRLATFHIPVPPLRVRQEAIPVMCQQLLQVFCTEAGRGTPVIDDEAMEVLKSYAWPGNVRQLKNEMLRLSVISVNGVISRPMLDTRITQGVVDLPKPNNGFSTLDILEKKAIILAMATYGSIAEAARKLGIGRQTLYNKIIRYDIAYKKGHQDDPVAK